MFDTPSCTDVGRSPGGRRGSGVGFTTAERYRWLGTLDAVTDRLRVVVAALAGTVAAVVLVLGMTFGSGQGLVRLIAAGEQGPAASVVRADLPDATLAPDVGHDGQQFYAVARAPMHIDEVARSLDRPRYRLQRPLLPWLAWLLHPSGGGPGLIWAMFGVGAGALLVGGLAFGALVRRGGGSPWWAAVFPLLPGAWSTLSIGGADVLALSLALAAILAVESRRRGWAAVAAVGAVLAKESIIVLLAGYALGHAWRWWKSRPAATTTDLVALVAAPVVVAGGWWLALHRVPSTGAQVIEFGPPLAGWWGVLGRAATSSEAMLWTVMIVVAVGATVVAVLRCADPSWRWALISQLLLLAFVQADVLGPDLNGARTTAPLVAAALVVLASPRRRRRSSRLEAGGPVDGVDDLHVGDGVVGSGGERSPVEDHGGERVELMGVGRTAGRPLPHR